MQRRVQSAFLVLGFGVVLLAACSRSEAPAEYMALGEFVEPQDSFPRIRYFDSNMASINDRCAVRKTKLNPKMPPVYANGEPVGFC